LPDNDTVGSNYHSDESIIRVLHVDDENLHLDLTKEYLGTLFRNQITVDSLSDPFQVMKKLEGNDYDCLVSDYRMPKIDGIELLKQLRDQNNRIPFIMLTGRGREEVAIEALNIGADHYIKKGTDLESQYLELGHVIKKVVHHRRTENRLRESEQIFQLLSEQNLLGTIILQDGQIKYVNSMVTDVIEYSAEEMMSWKPNEFALMFHPDDRPFILEQARKKQSGDEDVLTRYWKK